MTQFKYLSTIVSEDRSKPEVLARTAQPAHALARLKPIWMDKNVSPKTKIKNSSEHWFYPFSLYILDSNSRSAKEDHSSGNEMLQETLIGIYYIKLNLSVCVSVCLSVCVSVCVWFSSWRPNR